VELEVEHECILRFYNDPIVSRVKKSKKIWSSQMLTVNNNRLTNLT